VEGVSFGLLTRKRIIVVIEAYLSYELHTNFIHLSSVGVNSVKEFIGDDQCRFQRN
jgi:hypothetical protein